MHHPPFTQGLRPGLLVTVSTSVLEVPHGQIESAFTPFPIPSNPSSSHGHATATRSPLAGIRRGTSLRRLPGSAPYRQPIAQTQGGQGHG